MDVQNITTSQYKLLAKECDKLILDASEDRDQRVAINFLHVIRESQTTLERYNSIFKSSSNNFLLSLSNFYGLVKNILLSAYYLLKSIFFHEKKITNLNGMPIDFLFISHYVGEQNISDDFHDSYFGDLINKLEQSGSRSIVALINHTRDSSVCFKSKKNSIPIFLLHNSLNFSKILSIYRKLFSTFFLIKNGNRGGVSSKIIAKAKIEVFSPSTIRNTIIASQIKDIVSCYNPKCIVITYEGHAWERLAFSVTRSINPDIKCIAYQHAPVFRLQHAIRRNIGSKYNPDIILTSGLISKRQLEESKKLNGIPISILGSNRSYNAKSEEHSRKLNSKSCLVAPEGSIKECNILFYFSLRCANKMPDTIFIWRLPPLITLDSLIDYNKIFLDLPKNILLSKGSLKDDILSVNSILYRGSSVVIQSVVMGLRPIYLKVQDELTIDPLYELVSGRVVVSSVDEFIDMYNKSINYHDIKLMAEYCERLYTPLNSSVLEAIISNHDK